MSKAKVRKKMAKKIVHIKIEDVHKRKETVNHPLHYGGDTTYETIKVARAKLEPAEFRGAMLFEVMRYNSRAGKKTDTRLEDFQKGLFYQLELVRTTEEDEMMKRDAL